MLSGHTKRDHSKPPGLQAIPIGVGFLVLLLAFMTSAGCEENLDLFTAADTSDLGNPPPEPLGAPATLVAGDSTSCGLMNQTLFCWGANPNSVVVAQAESPLLVAGAVETPPEVLWVDLAAGGGSSDFVCGRTAEGQLYCWGENDAGQLGTGDFQARNTPVLVGLQSPVVRFDLGFDTGCAILESGELWCWGNRFEGQLGDGTRRLDPVSSPQRVEGAANWQEVSVGDGHVCGIRGGGELWCWGRNSNLQLGLGLGTLIQYQRPLRVGDATDWQSISAGSGHTCGIRREGELYCWGSDYHDQILDVDGPTVVPRPNRVGTRNTWTSVEANTFTTCGLLADGSAWCWGRNVEGQLGIGTLSATEPPTRIDGGPWDEVAVGRFHTCVRSDTQFFCAGSNGDGQLGVGDLERRNGLVDPVILP